MNWLHRLARPRLLAALAFAFALVPALLAVVTYRDAREKDERLFQTSAQVLAEQLQHRFERNTYFLGIMRGQAVALDDAALAGGRMVPEMDWQARLPQLLAFAYVEQTQESAVIRWKSDECVSLPRVGDVISMNAAISKKENTAEMAAAVRQKQTMDSLFPTLSIMQEDRRTLILLPVPSQKERGVRGYVAGWVDTAALCGDADMPLLRDAVLTARPLVPGEAIPEGALRVDILDSRSRWTAAIARGPRFSQQYGAPAPWLAFLAVGVSAVPLLVLSALAGRAGKLLAALAAEREITEQQRFFTQSVSHEFRTPLGVILSGADLLDRYADHLTPVRRAEILAEIKDNTRQMTDMVEGVLQLGRIESGKLDCIPRPVNIAGLCRDITRKIAAGAITVTAPEREAMLDATLIGSVLGNLLSNAVKYSPPGSPVSFISSLENDRITFTVRDQGNGISADELPRVCDPFHRCKNVGEIPGTGLGLAIALRCAELHGGTLKIESNTGSGTTATVTIPAA
jgi:signal transduction histidine kinase